MLILSGNPIISENRKYAGVGGHLFAIAADRSFHLGFGGAITGNAFGITKK